jgi:hypothetical protein
LPPDRLCESSWSTVTGMSARSALAKARRLGATGVLRDHRRYAWVRERDVDSP